jgi:hypothetical protein
LYSLDSNGVFKLVQTFAGHNGAVTCLAFDAHHGSQRCHHSG